MRKLKARIRHQLDVWASHSPLGRRAWSAWMSCGLDRQAWQLERCAAQERLRIAWRADAIAISRDEAQLLVRHDAGDVYAAIAHFDTYMRRACGAGNIADLRPPLRCLSDELCADLWYSSLPEIIPVMAGYTAQGPPRPGDCVFDFGAYCGETALAFARIVGEKGRVFAFEPDHENFQMLQRNIAEQGASNITPICKAIAGETGSLQFHHGGGLGAALSAAVMEDTSATDVLSYADACALAGRQPDFVKIDVEGAEIEIIQRALPQLAGQGTRFAIASYHVVGGRTTDGPLEEMFRSIGYQTTTGFPEHQTTWAWR